MIKLHLSYTINQAIIMNPLLGRLYQTRSRSKTKNASLAHEERKRNNSMERPLVAKIGTKVRLQSLPQPQTQKRLSTMMNRNIGKLPSINNQNTQEMRQKPILSTKTIFRNRKLSSSIKQMDNNFFSTQFEVNKFTEPFDHEQKLVLIPEIKPKVELRKEEPQQKDEQQLFQYLKVLQNNEDLNQQFCYMNRRQLPYSYYIVDYQDRNRDQYLTVSLRGITAYRQNEEQEFYTIPKFAKAIQHFKDIRRIQFFKEYLVIKVMQHWKSIMMRRKFNLKCKYITSHLFSQNRILQEYQQFLHSLAQDYSGGNFFNFHINLTQQLDQFIKVGQQGVADLVKSIKKFDHHIEKTLKNTFEQLMVKFRIEERVTLGSSDRKVRGQDEAYLPFDAKRKSMKYTQMAKLKQFQWMMYRMIKYTDLLRFNVKLEVIRKCYDNSISDLKNLKRASQNKETIRFTNWIEIALVIEGKPGNAKLVLTPSLDQLSEAVIEIKDNFLAQMFKEHRLLIQKKDNLFCEDLELEGDDNDRPSRIDLKYFVIKQAEFQNLQLDFQTSLKDIIDKIQDLFDRATQSLLKIYNKNVLSDDISQYLTNQELRKYLQNYRSDYEQVLSFEEIAEFALVMIKMGGLRDQVRLISEQKFKIITSAIPFEVIRRSQVLQDRVRLIHNKLKENPYSVTDYLIFAKSFSKNKLQVADLEVEMDSIEQYQELVYKHGIRIGEPAKLSVNDVSVFLKELIKRFQEVQQNQDKERKKFQLMTDAIVPVLEQKSTQLLAELKDDKIVNNYASDLMTAVDKIGYFVESYDKLLAKKQELFRFQRELDLGHRQMEEYDKMEGAVTCLDQVWKIRTYYLQALKFTSTKGYGYISELNFTLLNSFLANSEKYYSHLECFQLLNEFKSDINSLIKAIKLSQLISTPTLGPEHISDMKKLIKTNSGSQIKAQILFTKDNREKITPQMLIKQTNIEQIESQLNQIVFLSSQENVVKSQLTEIQDFWKKTKVALIQEDIAQNQQPILHLDANQYLHQKLGYFFVMLKNIEGAQHVAGIAHERAQLNGMVCTYLRELLWQWAKVEKEWISLLPVMANYSAVKHQSNVFFDFTTVDAMLKKFIRQISEMLSLRRLCQDHKDRKHMGTLEECSRILCLISKNFMNFLDGKRITYGRFCFLSDQELIQMLEIVKDARSASKFIPYCFYSEKIRLDGEVMAAFSNPTEEFKTRMIALKGQPDEIFKGIEANMKDSIKSLTKKVLPKLKIGTKPSTLFKQSIAQVLLICDRIQWTQLTQKYLTTNTFDDYKLLLRKQEERVVNYFKQASKGQWIQTAVRAMQLMHLREIGNELIRQQITSTDFKWKEQIRMYSTEEDIFVCHFDGKLQYMCQYRPPKQLSIPTNSSTRYLYQSYRACQLGNALVVGGHEGQGKRNLMEQASSMLGSYSKEVVCSSKLSITFLLKIVQGVLSANAWVSFYQFDNLNYSVLAELLATLYRPNPSEHRSSSLFTLIYHGKHTEQISPYSFLNFTVIEPDRQRICQWMLKMYKFKTHEELTQKMLKFLKVVKPFLHRAFGSQLRIIKHAINRAGCRRMELERADQQDELRLLADAVREEVVLKEEESKSDCLNRALRAHFGVELKSEMTNCRFQQKVSTIINFLKGGMEGIIVLGQRSCKSTAIRQATSEADLEAIWLYPQAREIFFTPQVIDFMRGTNKKQVIVYDGNSMMIEWADLMTAGHLFIEGRRAVLESQAIMELRTIENCSPSFVSKCQIIYMGHSVVSREQKFIRLIPLEHINHESARQALNQIYGVKFDSVDQNLFTKILGFIASIEISLHSKVLHRLVVWIHGMLTDQKIWMRQYGGSCYDLMPTLNYELLPVNADYYQTIQYEGYRKYLLVPTRQSTVLLLAINHLFNTGDAVHVTGRPQSGKTSLVKMFDRRAILAPNRSVEGWSQVLKKKFTYIRRQAHNWLIDLQKDGMRLIVDDLDLGIANHREYSRQLMQTRSFRDKHFNQYFLQKVQLLSLSRQLQNQQKYWSCAYRLKLPQLQKDSVHRIYQQNLAPQMSEYNMNRDVQQFINTKVMESCLIAVDDLAKIMGHNESSTIMLGLLRNILSLPKRQGHCSLQQYKQFFKTLFHSKLHQKSHNEKLRYQIKSVEDNILKVKFRSAPIDSYMLNLDGQFKPYNREQLRQTINKLFPQMVIFDQLLDTVVYLCNQIKCIDDSVVLLGRRGTGKRFLIQLCSKLAGFTFATTLSQAIIAAIKHKKTFYIQQVEGQSSCYEELLSCQLDKDLQKFVDSDKRDIYYSNIAGEDYAEGRLVSKCQQYITFLFLCDQRQSYSRFCHRRREVLNMPVCLVDEWPTEALLNLYTINDPHPNLHAQLFTRVNAHLSKNRLRTTPLKTFEKYLKVFYQIETKTSQKIDTKLKTHKQIHYKFNQSFEVLTSWEQRVETLRQEIEKTIITSGENIVANEVANMCLVIFLDQIKDEKEISAKEEAQLKILKYQIEKRLQLIQKVIAKIQKIVASFQRSQLGQLKKVYKANKVVYFGVECLCILLGEQNHQDKNINKILADSNLLMRMKSSEILEHRNPQLQAKFKKELDTYTKDIENNENQLAKTIIQWIKSIIQYWEVTQKQRNEQEKCKHAKIVLEESIKKHQELEGQVVYIKNIIKEKLSIVDYELEFKSNRQTQLASITKRLDNAVKIIPIIKNEQKQARINVQKIQNVQNNIRGNCILGAFTATFLPMRPLIIKQQLLDLAKSILQRFSIPFSPHFMAELSQKQIDALQTLNFFMIENCSLPKVVFDPQRKFMNFMEDNATQEMQDGIIQNSEERTEVQNGKIYHTTGQFKGKKDKVLLIDWTEIAIEQKEVIFLRIASFKRSQYFQVKKELQIKIARNLSKVRSLKEILYREINQKKMKIIEDDSFREQGQELRKLQVQTVELKKLAQLKLEQIAILTQEINQEATKVICIYESLKHYKTVDLDVILDVSCRDGDNINFLVRWALANLNQQHWTSFLITLVVSFNQQTRIDILKDIITKAPLKTNQSINSGKIKKPSIVSQQNWEIALKLSLYQGNFKQFPDNISKCPKEFEHWCIDALSLDPPASLFDSPLSFIQHLSLLSSYKERTFGYLSHKLLQKFLPTFDLRPLPFKQSFKSTNYKFPIISCYTIQEMKKFSVELNEGKCHCTRISKMQHEIDMKKVVWRCMEGRQWLLCYDFHSKKDLQMLQSICYYVMNYDKHEGFKVIIIVDHHFGQGDSRQEMLLKSSTFLSGVSVYLQPDQPSYDSLIAQYSSGIQYQINISGNQSSFGNKQIFNKMYRAITLTYCALVARYPPVRMIPFRRIMDILNFLKVKNIPVQFNTSTIVTFIAKITSSQVDDAEQRRQIEQLWQFIVDERKLFENKIRSIPINQENVDKHIYKNYKLTGHQQSYNVQTKNKDFQHALSELSRIYKTNNAQSQLAFVRTQLGRLPILIAHKESANANFAYFYNQELRSHNGKIKKIKNMLEQISSTAVKENYLQTLEKNQQQKLDQVINGLSELTGVQITGNVLRSALTHILQTLKQEHQFLLYFNPSLPTLIIQPHLAHNLSLLVSSYIIDRYCQNIDGQVHKLDTSLQFTKCQQEKDIHGQGLFLLNLQYKEFHYSPEMKSVGPSMEVDGIQSSPVVQLIFQPPREEHGEKVQDLEVSILKGLRPIFHAQLQYSTVFLQWGFRQPHLRVEP